jgi:hypothetical protein
LNYIYNIYIYIYILVLPLETRTGQKVCISRGT